MEILGHQAATASDKGHRAEIEEIWQKTATAPANLRSAFWASDRIHTRQSIGNRAELGRSNWHCLNPPLAVAGTFWSYRTSRLRMNPALAVAGTFLWDVPSAYESASAVAGTLFHDVPSAYESALAVAGISGLQHTEAILSAFASARIADTTASVLSAGPSPISCGTGVARQGVGRPGQLTPSLVVSTWHRPQ